MNKIKCLIPTIIFIVFSGCNKDNSGNTSPNPIYKEYMRQFVEDISHYARSQQANFIIVPQNGQELVTQNGDENGAPDTTYLRAIDGVGREDLFYGYNNDNVATPTDDLNYMLKFLNICKTNGIPVLTTDYCWTHSKMDDSYQQNNSKGFISFAAPDRELRAIPDYPSRPYNENANNILQLSDAKNFLYLINPEKFASKQEFIKALMATNYDVLILDLFFNDTTSYTPEEIAQLKTKQNGGKRLVIAYMSIGEAEDYRYYWKASWNTNPPDWIKGENPDWPGDYKVEYWDPAWQSIIFGSPDSYLDKIISKGFDGAYLDIIDAFEYFE